MALALPEAAEGDDHGTPAFTVGGKIFCTLSPDPPRITLKLTAEDQDNLVAGHRTRSRRSRAIGAARDGPSSGAKRPTRR